MHKDIFFSGRVCVISICFLHITCFFFGSLNVREFYPAVVVCMRVFFRCKYACKTSSHPTSSESQMVYPIIFSHVKYLSFYCNQVTGQTSRVGGNWLCDYVHNICFLFTGVHTKNISNKCNRDFVRFRQMLYILIA